MQSIFKGSSHFSGRIKTCSTRDSSIFTSRSSSLSSLSSRPIKMSRKRLTDTSIEVISSSWLTRLRIKSTVLLKQQRTSAFFSPGFIRTLIVIKSLLFLSWLSSSETSFDSEAEVSEAILDWSFPDTAMSTGLQKQYVGSL